MSTSGDDLDPARWREYGDLITDSLWLLGARDKSSSHVGDYWGNFVPQIPNQLIRRFTRRGEWVVDLFSGMGTTLIECRKLGRHGVGVELNAAVADRSRERIAAAASNGAASWSVLVADAAEAATAQQVRRELDRSGDCNADLVILHPPYHD